MAKIAIDIGHGADTFPPSKGVYKNGKGYAEHSFNTKLGTRIKALLEANGHTVILGQQPNKPDIPLSVRTNLYKREKVDLVVSLHANANNNADVNGRCVFYWGDSEISKKLAVAIRDEFKALGYSLHGNGLHASKVGDWTDLHITRVNTRDNGIPSALIEHGFMTGNKDFDLIFGNKQDKYIEDMAQADVAGIIKYLGGKVVKPSTSAPKPKPATSKQILHLPASAKTWRVYKPNGPYTVGNEIHLLTPSVYGGLEYEIKGNPATDIYLIDTDVKGRVAIYAAPSTGAKITNNKTPVAKPKPRAKRLYLPASAKLWKIYHPKGPYTSGSEIHNLTPSAYGGLDYEIKGNPAQHVYLIDTGVKGRVAIYAHPSTGAVIK